LANDTTILNGISDEVDSKVDVDMAALLFNKMKAIADICESFRLILPAAIKSGQSSFCFCRELDFVFDFH
jgi:hypothetical protein